MKLKVLGSGSSGNCYLLQNKDETLILEAGIPWKQILKGLDFSISNVVGCLVSHEHKDHSKAIKDLMANGIEVYASCGTWDALGDGLGFINGFIKSEHQCKVGAFSILPFDTQHTNSDGTPCAEPLGFLIQHNEIGKLLFITDSYYCRYKFNSLNHIMIECNYSKEILDKNIENGLNLVMAKRLLKSHFSLENVKEFLKANDLSKVKGITLIHLSNENSNAAEFKTEIERLTGIPVYIAEKGLEVEL